MLLQSCCLTDDNSIGESSISKRFGCFILLLGSRERYYFCCCLSLFFLSLESSHLIVRASCATMTSKDGNSKGRMERDLTTEVMRERIIVYEPAGGCTSGVTKTKSKESQRES